MKKENLGELKKAMEKAESFVSFIKDPTLKPVAFNRTLDHFLNGSDQIINKPIEKATVKKATTKDMHDGPKKWISDLIDENFFKNPKALSEIKIALAEIGHRLKSTDVQPYLNIFMKEKRLRRRKEKGNDGKMGWQYSNW